MAGFECTDWQDETVTCGRIGLYRVAELGVTSGMPKNRFCTALTDLRTRCIWEWADPPRISPIRLKPNLVESFWCQFGANLRRLCRF
jgi:hypothetical protein